MGITADKGGMTEIYCPYCNTFYGYITDKFFWFDETESEVRCKNGKCNKPFVIKKE